MSRAAKPKAAAAPKPAEPQAASEAQAAPPQVARRQAARQQVARRAKPAPRAARVASREPFTLASQPSEAMASVGPIALTPVQRAAIYRSIAEVPLLPNLVLTESIRGAPPVRLGLPTAAEPRPSALDARPEYPVGSRLPETVRLHPLPPRAVDAVPAIEPYQYAFVGDRILLVEPTTGIVAAALGQ